jgi:rSAM/selenodomain-associated transferase 1
VKNPILIIIAKEPLVGTTKTRLSPPLTLSAAAEFFEALLDDTIELAASIQGLDLAVAVTLPESVAYFKQKTPPETTLIPVTCIDIGDCLRQVFEQLFQMRYTKVLAFNSDGPSLPKEYIQRAIPLLDEHDVVFGPSEDGGYYLIGFKELYPALFKDIQWSTPQVLEESLAKAEGEKLSVALLPEWYDVDTKADLIRLMLEARTGQTNQLKHTRRFFMQLPEDLKSTLFGKLSSRDQQLNE